VKALLLYKHPKRGTAVLVLALALAGCGADSPNPSAAPSARTTSTSITTTAAVAATTETSTISAEASCGAQVFLPVLKQEFDNEAKKLRIVRADVKRCRNDYAQVFAVPDDSVCQPGIGYCYDSEQVLLDWSGGEWRILTYGTGITCEEPGFETVPVIRRVCRALGYPGY
jgi:hypothetical protein